MIEDKDVGFDDEDADGVVDGADVGIVEREDVGVVERENERDADVPEDMDIKGIGVGNFEGEDDCAADGLNIGIYEGLFVGVNQ